MEESALAGVANFAASVALSDSVFDCNEIHLNGEHLDGAFSFEDQGGNACGCSGSSELCKVLSSNLEPPAHPQ